MENIFLYEKDIYINGKREKISIEEIVNFGEYFVVHTFIEFLTTEIISRLNQVQFNEGIKYCINLFDKINGSDYIDENDEISIFLRNKRNSMSFDSNNINIYEKKMCSIDTLKENMNKKVLSMLVDGSNWRIHMSDGFILGNNKQNKIESIYKFPKHVQDIIYSIGDNDQESIVSANQFKNKHVFLNSCSDSLIDGSLYGDNLNVVQNMLVNTSSVISGYRMKSGHESENLLHAHLLKNGYNLHDIHYILNMNSTFILDESFPYINFGMIENKFSNNGVISELKLDINQHIKAQLKELKDSDFYQFDLVLEDNIFNNLMSKKSKLVYRNDDENIYYTYIPDPYKRKINIFVYSLYKFKLNMKDMKIIINDSKDNDQIEYINEKLRNLDILIARISYSKKLERRIKNLKNSIQSTFKNLPDYCSDTLEYYKVIDRIHDFEREFYLSCDDDFDKEFNYGLPMEKLHNKSNVVSLENHEQRCPQCNSPIHMKLTQLFLDNSKRITATCRECHNVYDRSLVSYEKNKDLVTFNSAYTKDGVTVVVNVKNLKLIRTSYFFLFYNTTDYSSNIDDIDISFDKDIHNQYFICDPGEKLQFNITFNRRLSEQEVEKFIDLNMYIFDNGSLEYFSNKILFNSRTKLLNEEHDNKICKIKEYLKEYLPKKRLEHSINVANQAILLAEKYGANIYDAEIASLLHDCVKGYEKNEKIISFLDNHSINYKYDNFYLSHAHLGKIVANKIFEIDDSQILGAIFWHTNGRANMKLLEKIIFVADYTAKERTFDNVEEIRNLSFYDLDKAIGKIMDYYIEVLCKMYNITPNDYELECRDYYK